MGNMIDENVDIVTRFDKDAPIVHIVNYYNHWFTDFVKKEKGRKEKKTSDIKTNSHSQLTREFE